MLSARSGWWMKVLTLRRSREGGRRRSHSLSWCSMPNNWETVSRTAVGAPQTMLPP